ncbi:MAG TPA: SsrA-binding protein SmpB [Erysipelotrichaceae bacterium]|nr:SsrA-binding protein SmpB [Erysipelotrichaceae bacterium]
MKIIAQNRRARYDYFLEEKFEAGIALVGTEVKSIRAGEVHLSEAFVEIRDNEVYINGMHVNHFRQGNQFNHEEDRRRKLLLNKREIKKLFDATQLQGYTIIPTKIYLKNGLVKLEIAIAKGKAQYDKRETVKKRDAQREIEKSLKQYR